MREWWRDAVIYQIYPRSFQDESGNGIGDLKGITRRLPHVASLGVDAIWLSPFFPSPQKDMGYDVSDYTDVDPLFGDLSDFDEMIETAHGLGLKVIIDQVLSHTSDKHPWFEESRQSRSNPKADWYVWHDPKAEGSAPNNWMSVFGGPAWEFDPRRSQYYLHNFLIQQPDLNFHNPEVQDALLETMRFWLDRGVDGFRLDTVNYYHHDPHLRDNPPCNPHGMPYAADVYAMQEHIFDKTRPENIGFLEKMRALCDEYQDIMMVGEVGEDGEKSVHIMAEYTQGTDRLHMAYSFAMLSPEFSAGHFRGTIEQFRREAPDGHPKWSFSNHDVMRHVSRWQQHANSPASLGKQAAALLLSFPGTIGIYQGEELGQLETELEYHELTDPPALRFWPRVKGRDGCRTPMTWEHERANAGFSEATPWLPVKDPQRARSVDVEEAKNDSVLHAYRETIAFRKDHPAMTRGDIAFLDLPEPILGFRREADGERLTCLFNLSPEAADLRLEGAAEARGPRNASQEGGSLHLPPNGFVYLAHDGDLAVSTA